MMHHLRHQKYKSKHTEMEYLNSIQRNRILKVKNSLSVFKKDIVSINYRRFSDEN